MTEKTHNAAYTLGLDIGIASVGAAVLGTDRIHGLYVRTFDRAEVKKTGESLGKIYRECKSIRRTLRRRRQRLTDLRQLLYTQGLITHQKAGVLQSHQSPWQLRAEGLDRLLSPKEWAIVLHHLVKRRGYHSTRKSDAANQEDGEMLSAIATNQTRSTDYRTVGEMVEKHPDFAHAKRNKGRDYSHTLIREQIEHELHTLFNQQRQFNNPHTDTEFEQAVHDLLMRRRPALPAEDILKMVGHCTLIPQAFRAPKACHSAERFVWLQKLNNLRLKGSGQDRPLSEPERTLLLELPFTQAKLTYQQVRKKLALDSSLTFSSVRYPRASTETDKDPELATFFEAKAFHSLRKAYAKAELKEQWQQDATNVQRLDDIGYALSIYKEDEPARAWLTEHGIEPAIIDAVLTQSFSGFLHLSLQVITQINPFLAQGARYDEAVQQAGYHHSCLPEGKKQRYLPRFAKHTTTNPVVARALNQARKLINAIVKRHGTPQAIHIELARDLAKPKKDRDAIEKEQETRRKQNEQDKADFQAQFGYAPKGQDLIKYWLYREQNGQCPYTGNTIDLNRLFSDIKYAEVDHILPYSLSYNDTFNNKVLVHNETNQNKASDIPYEYLNRVSERAFYDFSMRVKNNKNYNPTKQSHFLCQKLDGDESDAFRERHRNDTRYIAVALKNHIEQHLQLSHTDKYQRCLAVNGQMTALLRARWGLKKYRNKNDRHHALDAAVVGACSDAMVDNLSRYATQKETGKVDYKDAEDRAALNKGFWQPWPAFRKEILALMSDNPQQALRGLPHYDESRLANVHPLRVSRAATGRRLGAAHQETIRTAKYLADNKSTKRTPLSDCKLKDLPRMVGYEDPRNQTMIAAIRQRLEQYDDNPKKAFVEPLYKPAKAGKQGPQIKEIRLFTKEKSHIPVRGGIAHNGSMMRIDLFEKKDRFFVVPVYVSDRVNATLPNRAAMSGKTEDQWQEMDETYRFCFSLWPNDWVRIIKKPDAPAIEGYYVSFNRANATLTLRVHDREQSVGKGGEIGSIGIKTAYAVEKYRVDLLGQLFRAQAETRQTY